MPTSISRTSKVVWSKFTITGNAQASWRGAHEHAAKGTILDQETHGFGGLGEREDLGDGRLQCAFGEELPAGVLGAGQRLGIENLRPENKATDFRGPPDQIRHVHLGFASACVADADQHAAERKRAESGPGEWSADTIDHHIDAFAIGATHNTITKRSPREVDDALITGGQRLL